MQVEVDNTREGTKHKIVHAYLNKVSATSGLVFDPLELRRQYVHNKMINRAELIHKLKFCKKNRGNGPGIMSNHLGSI